MSTTMVSAAGVVGGFLTFTFFREPFFAPTRLGLALAKRFLGLSWPQRFADLPWEEP
jgi:hypothetical protein